MVRAVLCLAAAVSLSIASLAFAERSPERPHKPAAVALSGPFTEGNLTIYLIHGPDVLDGKHLVTLDEALEKKIVVVHETKNVNELSIENISKDIEVFIQAGDIVKGGQQDRVLSFDLLVPPLSKKVPLAAFCVEAGRWTGRGPEPSGSFGSCKDALSSNNLKLAARGEMSQSSVWANVAEAQQKLAKSVKEEVKDGRSATSYQLTLENKKVSEAIATAIKKLTPCLEGQDKVVGLAVAINGKMVCADTYATSALFHKLWPKLLKSAAIEAVAEFNPEIKFEVPKADVVRAFLAQPSQGKSKERVVSARMKEIRRETDKVVSFETHDAAHDNATVRCSYLAITAPIKQAPANGRAEPARSPRP